MNNFPPTELCARIPELNDYGFYRKLNDGKLEFISICSPEITHWLSVLDKDFNAILDQTIPGRKNEINN
jgi:hypothetical protein